MLLVTNPNVKEANMPRTMGDVLSDIAAAQSEMIAAALRLQGLQAELAALREESGKSLEAAKAASKEAWRAHRAAPNCVEALVRWERTASNEERILDRAREALEGAEL